MFMVLTGWNSEAIDVHQSGNLWTSNKKKWFTTNKHDPRNMKSLGPLQILHEFDPFLQFPTSVSPMWPHLAAPSSRLLPRSGVWFACEGN